jgi:hypothetical protein
MTQPTARFLHWVPAPSGDDIYVPIDDMCMLGGELPGCAIQAPPRESGLQVMATQSDD